ncbi:putative membrane protein [Clostridium bornimense]|uniref:Putative membrane protein n=1 Tax=Clostridium bornimense TaxID=1216932 RepID=W6RWH6_9CLOT|nr:PQQ-binding-like beta-propeller repeat protein [Clostridium bornimense]CDM69036.1 putative membrane protein [Clostridium bornimense]
MKLVKSLIASIVITVITSNVVLAGSDSLSLWTQFRGNILNPAITDSKTPTTSLEVKEKWSVEVGEGWKFSDPIIVGDYIYSTDSSKIKKYSRETGEEILSNTLTESISWSSRIAYGDGKIFVPTNNGRIQCVDADTLDMLWISPVIEDTSLQGIGTVVYYDGYVYCGVSSNSGDNGFYYALSVEDKNTKKSDEIKDYAWKYEPKEGKKGYYLTGGAVVGNNIIFAGEKGEVVAHSLKEDKVIDAIDIGDGIRSSIHYDKKSEKIYLSTKGGSICSIKVNEDGTFDKGSLISTVIGADSVSSPVVYNGRVYVCSGKNFLVLDGTSLNTIYQIWGISSKSSPILTTAYANKDNNNTVYLYVFNSSSPDSIYCIKDFEGNTKENYEKIISTSKPHSNNSSAAIDEYGSIYFKNDSGYLFCFKNENGEYIAEDIILAINNLPDINEITLDDKIIVKNILNRYNSLSDEEKKKVSNVDMLNNAITKIESLKNIKDEVANIIKDINNLPEVITIEEKNTINQLLDRYNALPEGYKSSVTNIDVLLDLSKKLDNEEKEKEVNDLISKIDSLPSDKDVVLDNKEEIYSLYNQFEKLTEEEKAKVTNIDKLMALKNRILEIREIVNGIRDDIWEKVDKNNITLDDKETVEDIVKRYDALNSKDRKYVDNFSKVEEAKGKIEELAAGIILTEDDITDNKDSNNSNKELSKTGGIGKELIAVIAIIILISGIVVLYLSSKKKNIEDKNR